MHALLDSRTFYIWNMKIYAETQPKGPFKLENSPHKTIMRLTEPSHNCFKLFNIFYSGRILTVDN